MLPFWIELRENFIPKTAEKQIVIEMIFFKNTTLLRLFVCLYYYNDIELTLRNFLLKQCPDYFLVSSINIYAFFSRLNIQKVPHESIMPYFRSSVMSFEICDPMFQRC